MIVAMLGSANEYAGQIEVDGIRGLPRNTVSELPPGVALADGKRWVWVGYWQQQDIPPITEEDMVDRLYVDISAKVAQKRIDVMQLGYHTTFPPNAAGPGGEGTIQMRDQTDISNINAVGTEALIFNFKGVVDPVCFLRVEENVIYPLTPLQAIDIVAETFAYGKSQYAVKWVKDAQLKNLKDTLNRDGLVAFDVDSGWGQVPAPPPLPE